MRNQTELSQEATEAVNAITSHTSLIDRGSGGYDRFKVKEAIKIEFTKQAQRKEDNRASNKRRRQLKERLTSLVSKALKEFENRYMTAYTEWSMTPIKMTANLYPSVSTQKEMRDHLATTTYKDISVAFPAIKPNIRRGENEDSLIHRNQVSNIYYSVMDARNQMNIEALTRFEFMSEAANGYAQKFERLINKMVDYEFDTRFLKVEQVNNAGDELSFLITNDERAIHARAIFVNGAIKAPHYRFITTERKK